MTDPSTTLEIRVHGRGGQGGVTCAKILAAIYASLGRSVQSFGDYAGERSGAPVRAYTRVASAPIANRNKVYRPDHLLVLDPTLLGPDVIAGLAPRGTLLVNAADLPEASDGRFDAFRLALVDATAIARKHRIGTRSLVIVNTTIAGAFVRALGLPFASLESTYEHLGLLSNLPAAREAHESVTFREARGTARDDGAPGAGRAAVPSVVDLLESPATPLKTGNWRTQTPHYAENLAPCSAWCPAGNDVVGFVRAIATEGPAAAAAILGRTTPLAAVCGRVCPAPCMDACNRSEHDGAVNIRALERFVADRHPVALRAREPLESLRRFAVVGGGPAGLSAAYQLALRGHVVTIHDGEASLGGLLRTGIPSYRLSRSSLDAEIGALLALGVRTALGTFLDAASVARLVEMNDAVILATGLQRPRELGGGEKPRGVEQGIAFLRRVNLGSAERIEGCVVVLGGGNTAMDCARSALRAGASAVTIVYRRSRVEMPAIREELEQAEEEGAKLEVLRAPLGFRRRGDGSVSGVVVAEVELGPPDGSGRRAPIVTSRMQTIPCDRVLLALGQSADLSLLPKGFEIRDGRGYENGVPRTLFLAGDVATGDGTVTHAIGDGHRAASRALAALGAPVAPFARPDRRLAVPVTDIRLDHFAHAAAARETHLPPAERILHWNEVSAGLDDGVEAHRCFSCGHCTRCDTCLVYCPEGIIRRRTGDYEVDYAYCKGCGICVAECPRRAIEMRAS
ncbi:MAG: 2-oxoacid:acceptor oxidoreductase family protein [Acidobacteriota bacterium]